jgi:NADPH-dependent glutamate synthase beta subunit-like oxidoreductase
MMIRVLKRFVADRDTGFWRQNAKVAQPTGKRVAIIGSGPAGLTAAYYLAKQGHSVSVFEMLPEPGGMMRFGIPAYRLPKDVLGAEIEVIKSFGVDIKTNTKVESLDELFEDGYEAIFVALGAHQSTKIGAEGEDSPGVIDCLSFLEEANQGKKLSLGDRVAVIGGGNSAVDAARVALRLGAREVIIVYRRTKAEMPASEIEVEEALQEGVRIQFLAAPTKITNVNGTIKMECNQMVLGKLDASGRPRPEAIPGSEFTMDVDTVISAIGQRPEIPSQFGLPVGRGNTLQIDSDTLATNKAGVFAGGDVVSGPASVIEAVAAGRKAAVGIDKYLGGSGVIDEILAPLEEEVAPFPDPPFGDWVPIGDRAIVPALPVSERVRNFAEIELGLDEKAAISQAKRCLRCDLPIVVDSAKCCGCHICEMRCSFRHEGAFVPGRALIKVYRVGRRETEYEHYFSDECDFCGICVRYCPMGALVREKKRR